MIITICKQLLLQLTICKSNYEKYGKIHEYESVFIMEMQYGGFVCKLKL